jgi:hypothetical protein
VKFSDLGSTIATVAPTIAGALGGPLAGLAARTIAEAVTGKAEAPRDAWEAAVAAQAPETLAALKQAEATFRQRLAELEIEAERIHAGDRADARAREAATGDVTPRVLAAIVVAGFFLVIGWMLRYGAPKDEAGVFYLLLGALTAAFTGVFSYYFGSSAGSKDKTEAMQKLMGPRP